MSTGNQYGLSEISHFGAFQRVGGKAGGFINKKFFHPSSIRNQEKLWKAQTEDEREARKQAEMQKRRDEERQVEDLRKQMYLSGQGSAQDSFITQAEEPASSSGLKKDKHDQKAAHAEFKRRREMVRMQQAKIGDDGAGKDEPSGRTKARVLLQSKYEEDVHDFGHESVWGSWYSMESKQWGYTCCRTMSRSTPCPFAKEEDEAAAKKSKAQGKKRKKVDDAGGDADPAEGGLAGGLAKPGRDEPPSLDSLMDHRMFAAAERRKEQKRLAEEQRLQEKEKAQGSEGSGASAYLADLLAEPTGT
mmetsp:Transcript_41362/g.95188  ORF Transcript_41362/g.95188 Transcript_41362/m.95188 type:complete len:303 (-) Transcript_41362:36-944(-)